MIHESWSSGEILDALANAKESTILVGSLFNDATVLADHICKASRATNRDRVDVRIYMLDPESHFGGARLREVYHHGLVKTEGEWQADFRQKYETAQNDFEIRLPKDKIALTFYKYSTMPALRMYIIDDKRYFFSWFPPASPAASNLCFEVSTESSDHSIGLVIDKLKDHLAALNEKSVAAKSTYGSPG